MSLNNIQEKLIITAISGTEETDPVHHRSVSLERGEPQLLPMGSPRGSRGDVHPQLPPLMLEERADRVIRDAESARACINVTPGKSDNMFNNEYIQSFMMDDEYMLVGAHVDEATYSKIIEGIYVDFGKLIPRDRIAVEEDQRLEMVIRGGKTYWVPPNETSTISNIVKCEQAFRMFLNIYTKKYPFRASELIEYNPIIHYISGVYSWNNVYNYNKDFRIHMGRNPSRNWSIILQHSWSLRLRDKIHKFENSHNTGGSTPKGGNGAKSSGPCHRYNCGKCNFGANCKYEHKCSYCFKFGHTILTCRKLKADLDHGGNGPKKNFDRNEESRDTGETSAK